jgi:hypothetical protein
LSTVFLIFLLSNTSARATQKSVTVTAHPWYVHLFVQTTPFKEDLHFLRQGQLQKIYLDPFTFIHRRTGTWTKYLFLVKFWKDFLTWTLSNSVRFQDFSVVPSEWDYIFS